MIPILAAIPLKYFNNFWRILEMFLGDCEINLNSICSVNSMITGTLEATRLHVLSTQDKARLLQNLKLGFKQ